jgi:hypothetical protein
MPRHEGTWQFVLTSDKMSQTQRDLYMEARSLIKKKVYVYGVPDQALTHHINK